ncbi:MAG: ferritin [Phycisphaerae bacterium]|nr:MAG: ferritin [Planctomycetota bacterium]KAB2944541.1 MAG: ferritin [Phycisphaerae bacterium]MBE7456035.1 ferritin [Planctomycetia bacterium]MCK6465162.1 ferritin [Phycisphaerae bacterium]MCL4717293.1 ferritin [Phycisphaerae bacterium]
MTVSDAMNRQLNEQIANELGSYYTYLAMSCELFDMGYKVLSKFFSRQAEEERGHAMKFLHYLQEVGSPVRLAALPAPKTSFGSPLAIAQGALDQEQIVTRQIHELVALAEKDRDYPTQSFLTWFVDEQVEEVRSMRDLVQLIQRAGDQHLLFAEHRVAQMMAEAAEEDDD